MTLSNRTLLAVLATTVLVGALVLASTLSRAHAEDEIAGGVVLDYEYYKARVAPIVVQLCAECHANPRERREIGRHFLRPIPGRRVRESHHRRNFETISALVEPGNPAASLYLLKPIDPRQGGLTHKGGTRLGTNTPEYGSIVDWINGATLPPVVWKPPETVEGQPDFKYYVANVAPVVQAVCAECHQGKGYGKFKVRVPLPDEDFTLEDRVVNYFTILQLIEPGKPDKSKFLQKPLAGGLRHRGGDRILPGDENERAWREFIVGVEGPPLPTNKPAPTPVLTTRGLTFQAEAFAIGAELSEVDQAGAEGTTVEAVDGDGDMYVDFAVQDAGIYRISIRVLYGGPPLRWSLDQQRMEYTTEALEADADEYGFVEVGPRSLSDGLRPLLDVDGSVRLEDGRLEMDAEGIRARWLSAEQIEHDGVEAHVTMPEDVDGGDDALLLFDAIDAENGKVVGLTDGGRRMVIGLIEGGRLRILDSAPARPREGETVRKIRVHYLMGVAIGYLDDRPHVHANLSEHLGSSGRFGFLTHGLATVHRLVVLEQFEVYRVAPRESPVAFVPAGRHRLWIEVPQGGGLVDRVRIEPTDE